MADKINLLHLSDLHISNAVDSNVHMIEKALASDIKKTIEQHHITLHAVLITGDLINRGQLSLYQKAEDLLDSLSQAIDVPKENIIMVPGNHDIPRSQLYSDICSMPAGESLCQTTCPDLWSVLSSRFSDFSSFSKKYNGQDDLLSYGVGIREIELNNYRVHFYLLNTSWLSCGSEDYQKLAIGRWQYETLCSQKSSLHTPDLVIAMTHHPLNWLRPEQMEMAEDFLYNKKKLGTDLLLHGHVHNARLRVIQQPDHGIAELTSGIGYPDYTARSHGQNKVDNCRYSIYEVTPESKSLSCICRKSTERGDFVPDVSLYSSNNESGIFNLSWAIPSPSATALESAATIAPMPSAAGPSMELDPVPFISGWCGRKHELELLTRKEYRAILISGVGGQGKTALAAEYLHRMKALSCPFQEFLWVDCRELQDTMQLKLQQLLEVMSGGTETTIKFKDETLPDTINRFISHLRQTAFLIVFDNVDAYVSLDNEEFIHELHLLIDKALNIEHKSQLILTCRIPVYDSRANFTNIKLEGLKEPEGISFFQMRGIPLDTEQERNYCKQIIQKTKGHPWWLGLIAGQILTGYTTFQTYMEDQGNVLVSGKIQLQDFFDSIWNHLGDTSKGKISQNVLRHLVEATKPLTQAEVSSTVEENYSKTGRVIQSLKKLGLLEPHQDTQQQEYLYQVHPLLREYLHGKYSRENQTPYVKKVLGLFLDNNIITVLFNSEGFASAMPPLHHSSKDLLYSIETCLNSRNVEKAFELLCYFYSRLRDDGFHKEYLSLGCRVFKELNWEQEQVAVVYKKALLLADLIDTLDSMGDKQNYHIFLSHYERLIEPDTIPYSGYLGLKAHLLWRHSDWGQALSTVREYEEMKQKNSALWDFHTIKTTKGLILRDLGNIPEAMKLFEELSSPATDYGNMARCYQKNKEYQKALENLEKSLELLKSHNNLEARINEGYAYQWMSEVYQAMGETDLSAKYAQLFRKCWKEYAPGLLNRLENV